MNQRTAEPLPFRLREWAKLHTEGTRDSIQWGTTAIYLLHEAANALEGLPPPPPRMRMVCGFCPRDVGLHGFCRWCRFIGAERRWRKFR